MKRTIAISFLTVMLSLGAVSCGKEMPSESSGSGRELVLRAGAQSCVQDSRSAVESTVLPDTYTIHAAAYFNATDGSGSSRSYLLDEHFNQISPNVWQSDPVTYWPLGGSLDFLCVACEDGVMDLSGLKALKWNQTRCSDGVTVDVPNVQDMQTEILYASSPASSAGSSDAVELEFSHSQALLVFNLSCTGKGRFRICDITVDRMYMNAKLKIDNSGTDLTADWILWYSFPQTAYVPAARDGIIITPSSSGSCSFIVIPQEVRDFTIEYKYSQDASPDWSKVGSQTAVVSPSAAEWEMGNRYVYNINFEQKAMEITQSDVTVEEFIYSPDVKLKL